MSTISSDTFDRPANTIGDPLGNDAQANPWDAGGNVFVFKPSSNIPDRARIQSTGGQAFATGVAVQNMVTSVRVTPAASGAKYAGLIASGYALVWIDPPATDLQAGQNAYRLELWSFRRQTPPTGAYYLETTHATPLNLAHAVLATKQMGIGQLPRGSIFKIDVLKQPSGGIGVKALVNGGQVMSVVDNWPYSTPPGVGNAGFFFDHPGGVPPKCCDFDDWLTETHPRDGLTAVSTTSKIRWACGGTVSHITAIRWHIGGPVTHTLKIRWAGPHAVWRVVTLRWTLNIDPAIKTVKVRWHVRKSAEHVAKVRWRIGSVCDNEVPFTVSGKSGSKVKTVGGIVKICAE